MFNKVLVPVELTDRDSQIVHFVAGLSKYGIKEIILIHVAGLKGVERPVAMRQEKVLHEDLKERSAVFENAGIKVKNLLTSGVPQDEILQAADDEDVSLIVCGTHGKGAFNELAIGSVSESVGRRAKQPVLMVPYRTLLELSTKEIEELGAKVFECVLYPTDFSDIAETTLEFIKSLDATKIGELIVAHVIEPKELKPEHKDAVVRSTKRILAAIKEELTVFGFNARAELAFGAAVAEVLQMADEANITTCVLGSHGRGLGEQLVYGSVSQNIIRMSRRPVFVMH